MHEAIYFHSNRVLILDIKSKRVYIYEPHRGLQILLISRYFTIDNRVVHYQLKLSDPKTYAHGNNFN